MDCLEDLRSLLMSMKLFAELLHMDGHSAQAATISLWTQTLERAIEKLER